MEILAFDALVDNSDRRIEKPNLLVKGGEIHLFDHELTFASRQLVGKSIVDFGAATLRSWIADHPLREIVKSNPPPIQRFVRELGEISDTELEWIRAQIPFAEVTNMTGVMQRLSMARDDPEHFVEQVRGAVL